MKVYILEYGRPHPSVAAAMVGVFSTYELAKKFADDNSLYNWEVDEFNVDALVESNDVESIPCTSASDESD